MIDGSSFPVLSAAELAEARGLLDAARRNGLGEHGQEILDAYLHPYTGVPRVWADGWPGNPPGPVR